MNCREVIRVAKSESAESENDTLNVYSMKNGVLLCRWVPPNCHADDTEGMNVHHIIQVLQDTWE